MKNKTVADSQVIISHVTLPEDANPSGMVHGGVIMKLIDNAAGVVAVRHTRRNAVTVSIDRLDFHNPVFVGNLVIIKASINLVCKTSMEIGVRVEAEDLMTGEVSRTASAYLTFVALGKNHRPVEVLPVIFESDDQKRRNSDASKRRAQRISEKRS